MIAKALPQLPRDCQLRELFPEETVPAQVGRPLKGTWVILKALWLQPQSTVENG